MISLEWLIVFQGFSFGLGWLLCWYFQKRAIKTEQIEFPPRKLNNAEKFLMDIYLQQKIRTDGGYPKLGKPVDNGDGTVTFPFVNEPGGLKHMSRFTSDMSDDKFDLMWCVVHKNWFRQLEHECFNPATAPMNLPPDTVDPPSPEDPLTSR